MPLREGREFMSPGRLYSLWSFRYLSYTARSILSYSLLTCFMQTLDLTARTFVTTNIKIADSLSLTKIDGRGVGHRHRIPETSHEEHRQDQDIDSKSMRWATYYKGKVLVCVPLLKFGGCTYIFLFCLQAQTIFEFLCYTERKGDD